MPLENAHKEFINLSIEDLFDLPPDIGELNFFAKKYSGLFFEACKATRIRPQCIGEDRETYSLYLCIAAPQSRFLQLETIHENKQFTVGDVQIYIFEYITALFTKIITDNHLNITLKQLPWINRNTLNLWLNDRKDKNEKFTSRSNNPESHIDPSALSWLTPTTSDCIYSCRLVFTQAKDPRQEVEYDPYHIYLKTDVILDPATVGERISYLCEIPPMQQLETDAQHDAFKNQIKNLANDLARKDALNIIFDYINERDNPVEMVYLEPYFHDDFSDALDADEISEPVESSRPPYINTDMDTFHVGFHLLLHSFYLRALLKQKFTLEEMHYLTQAQVDTLLTPEIIGLITDFDLTLIEALIFEKHHIRILQQPLYSGLHRRNLVKIQPEQSKILLLPSVINLQKRKILSFEQASQLSIFTAAVLCEQFYYDFLIRQPTKLALLECDSREQKDNLLNERIIHLIGDNKLLIEHAKNLSGHFIELINQPYFYDLLCKSKVKWNNLYTSSRLLNDEPAYILLFKRDPQRFDSEKLHEIAECLQQLFDLLISNIDSQEKNLKLENAFHHLSLVPHFSYQDLMIILMQKILLNVKILTREESSSKTKTSLYFNALTERIIKAKTFTQVEENPDWIAKIWLDLNNDLIEITRRFPRITTSSHNVLAFFSLFRKAHNEDKSMQALCNKFLDEAMTLQTWYGYKSDIVYSPFTAKDFTAAYRS